MILRSGGRLKSAYGVATRALPRLLTHPPDRRNPVNHREPKGRALCPALPTYRHARPCAQASKQVRGARTQAEDLIPLTVPEVRRLLAALIWHQPSTANTVLDWSRWRRRHQARARRCHYTRRGASP